MRPGLVLGALLAGALVTAGCTDKPSGSARSTANGANGVTQGNGSKPGKNGGKRPNGHGTPPQPDAGAATPIASGPSPCKGPDPVLAVGTELRPTKLGSEPAPRTPYRDPVFGTCTVRVTDRSKDLKSKGEGGGFTNEYSRVDSFNADGSLLLVRSVGATWYIHDAKTFAPKKKLGFEGPVDPRWDSADPDVLYYTPDTALVLYRVSSGKSKTVRDFAGEFAGATRVWGRYEGSPSDDGNRWAFMASNDDGHVLGLLTYDLREEPGNADGKLGQLLGKYDLRVNEPAKGLEEGGPDNISFSHNGKHVLVPFEYCERGEALGTFKRPCGAMVFDPQLKHARALLRTMGHQDFVLMPDGSEVVVYQDTDTDQIAMVDLASGKRVDLTPIDFSKGSLGLHVSGRGSKRPGWAMITVYDGNPKDQKSWMDGTVFLLEAKDGGRVVQVAHHHSSRDDEAGDLDYFAEPHGSVNRDFTRLIWTSNWGRTRTNVTEVYLAELPGGPPR